MGQKLFWLAVAGGLGTLSRYALAGWVQRWAGGVYPWGTVAVNATGCFAFGIIWAVAGERWAFGQEARTVILVGFLGAFTTFSTLVSESSQLAMDSEWLLAIANLFGQNALGIAAYFLGLALGRMI
jgi:CrcB protein